MVTETKPKLKSSNDMLTWQFKTLLGEIQQIELHETGDCPCILNTLDPQERCLGKHLLNVSTLSAETANMDSVNRDWLLELADEASERHEQFKGFVCQDKELPALSEWARGWRKKHIEPVYYTCKARMRQEPTCSLAYPKEASLKSAYVIKVRWSLPDSDKSITTDAMLDTGTTKTVISREIARKLGATVLGKETVDMPDGSKARFDVTQVRIYWGDYSSIETVWIRDNKDFPLIGYLTLEAWGFLLPWKPLPAELQNANISDVPFGTMRQFHKAEIAGSTPAPATMIEPRQLVELCQGDKSKVKLYQEPKVKISGSCTVKEGCSIKVKGAVETVQTTTAAGLTDAIDAVIRHLEKRVEGQATPLTYAIGSTSLTRYELRHKVVEAKSLIPSNNPITFEPNPAYPQDLQPRLRGRAANKAQVLTMAANLDPDALLDDFHSIDRGAPIVDDSGVVLSGNGRVMAILHALSEFPASYEVYKSHLLQAAPNYGLKVGKVQSPVLVRELVSKVDRRTFVEEANASTTIAASAIEVARSDAQKITAAMLNSLEVAEGQGVEDALRSSANASFVSSFLSKLSANERGGIADAKGMLNQDGIRRLTMAIFVNVFPGDVGIRLAEKFFESTDVNVRLVFNGIVGSLGKLAQSEALTREGQRNPDLQIGDDLARAVVAFSDIKKTPGMTVDKYLNQSQMFERQLNEFQEKLLSLIDKRSRSGKKVATLLKAYADVVIASSPPAQGALIPGGTLTKEVALDVAIKRSEDVETTSMFQAPKWCSTIGTAAKELDKAIRAVGTSRNRLNILRGKLDPSLNICRGQSLMFQSPPVCQGITSEDIKKLVEKNCQGESVKLRGNKDANLQGHFTVKGKVNKREYDFLVDTGFTLIGLPVSDIRALKLARLGNKEMVNSDGKVSKETVYGLVDFELDGRKTNIALVMESGFPILGTLPLELLWAKVNPLERKLEYIPGFQSSVSGGKGELHQADPLLTEIASQLCDMGTCLLASGKKSKTLPLCSPPGAKKLERCILSVKERNVDKGCKPEGTGSKKCPSARAVCISSVGCKAR
uniref:Putative aspartyl protease n=1 Tax=viral metagenome TaxID=1070528 RepID=A0A6M3IRC7_9ZZZZ